MAVFLWLTAAVALTGLLATMINIIFIPKAYPDLMWGLFAAFALPLVGIGFVLHEIYAESERFCQLYELNAYNTEFACVLADHSTIRTTIHFEIPSELSATMAIGHQPTYYVEQLNRVTETILLRFTAPKTSPPNAPEIEEHLETSLRQFQNEKRIPILRLKVATLIHISPEKPKGVNV